MLTLRGKAATTGEAWIKKNYPWVDYPTSSDGMFQILQIFFLEFYDIQVFIRKDDHAVLQKEPLYSIQIQQEDALDHLESWSGSLFKSSNKQAVMEMAIAHASDYINYYDIPYKSSS